MLNLFDVPALLFFLASNAWAAEVPRFAHELTNFSEAAKSGAQDVRLRMTVASDVAQVEPSVRVGDLLLCAPTTCYRARTSGYVNIANTAKGKANVVADVVIPGATITDLYFADVSGASSIKGHLKLDTPLAINKTFSAVALMIEVQKQKTGTQTRYVPVQSARMVFTEDSELVHYLPSIQTVADLSLGAKLTVPAGALDRPQIFNIGISKVGEMFPKIDIFPYIQLKKAARLEVRAVRNTSVAHELVVPVMPAEHSSNARTLGAPTTQPSVKLTFYRTAVIEASVLEKSLGSATPFP